MKELLSATAIAAFIPAVMVLCRLLTAGGGNDLKKLVCGRFSWLLALAPGCCLPAPVMAASSGDFSYTDNGTYIVITGCPTTAVGAVEVPSSIVGKPVKVIGQFAFARCRGVTSVTIPASVTTVGHGAFIYCSGLSSVIVAADHPYLSYADGLLFNKAKTTLLQCVGAKTGYCVIPKGVTRIQSSALQACSGLTGVTIPGSVTMIEDRAFYECTGLTGVVVPDSVTGFGTNMFYGCTGLVSARLPGRITSIPVGTFTNCRSLTGITVPSLVASIGSSAFFNCTSLAGVTIPFGVTLIEGSAFQSCTAMKRVAISGSVTTIGSCAFKSCGSLTSISIPGSVTSIGSGALSDCGSLLTITVDTRNPAYSSAAGILYNKSRSTLVHCPAGIAGSITVPSDVTCIGTYAFCGCGKLTGITISSGVTVIDSYAFDQCGGLTGMVIPAGVTTIGYGAFSSCTGVTSLHIPVSVTTIDTNAFTGCGNLAAITVDDLSPDFSSADGILFNKSKTTLVRCPEGMTGSVAIPQGILTIEAFSFRYCRKLTSVTIPGGVTTIGMYAFEGCSSLRSVTIPASVTSIGDSAFHSCTRMTAAHFLGNAPSGAGNIRGAAGGFTVYYFSGSTGFTSPTWSICPAIDMGEPTPGSRWLISKGLPYDADLQSDPNHDGVNLLLAYALNLDPNQNPGNSMPLPAVKDNQVSLTFYAGAEGVVYSVEASTDLQNWSATDVTLSPPDARNCRTATVPMTNGNRFLRIMVSY